MKKIFTKILPCLLVLVSIATLASCKKSKYNYPSVTPEITAPNGVFMELGSKTISNKSVYTRLLQSYGLTTLVEWVDSVILQNNAIKDTTAFEEQMNYIKYGTKDPSTLTEEEKEEKYQDFLDSMLTQGYETEAEWTAYYELEYKRYEAGLESFKEFVAEYNANEEKEEPYFTEDEYQFAYETLYQPDFTVILVTFDSELEAKNVMRTYNIDTNKLTGAWVDLSGNALTASQIKEAFTNMHALYGQGGEAEKTYKFDDENYRNELAEISSTIANKVASLEAMDKDLLKSYTHAPLTYGNRYYLALKVSETEVVEKYEDVTDESVKKAVEDYLYESSLTNAYLLVALNKLQQKAGLTIFDEGLEKAYNKYFNENFANASITDYDKFQTTTAENNTVIATITVNGKEHQLTAQDMFERLVEHYGTALSLLYVQEYVILSNSQYNKVFNFVTGEVLDKETYDKYYKSDVTDIKNNFNKGKYESEGFPASYGWENFLRDYLGVLTETDLFTNYGGSLYNAAEAAYIKDIYMGEVEYEKDENGEFVLDEDGNKIVSKTADQLVQDEMDKIFNDYFSATMVGVYAFYDVDLDGVSDEMTEEQSNLAKELVNLVYAEAKNDKYDTITEGLSDLVKQYKLASKLATSTSIFAKYKAQGLRLALVSSTTYTNSSSVADEIKAEARAQWEAVRDYKGDDTSKPDPIGQTLDPGYRSVINSKVHYITSADFADERSAFIANDAAYRLVITKANNYVYISSYYKTYKPTLAQYENYLLDDDDDNKETVSSALSKAITTYYIAAINNLTSEDIVNGLIFGACQESINTAHVKFVSFPGLKDKTLKLIEVSLKNDDTDK